MVHVDRSRCQCGIDQSECGGDVRAFHVADPNHHIEDAVFGIAEVLNGDAFGIGHPRYRLGLHRDDQDVLLQHVDPIDVGPHRQWGGLAAPVEIHRRARQTGQRRSALGEIADEVAQRPELL